MMFVTVLIRYIKIIDQTFLFTSMGVWKQYVWVGSIWSLLVSYLIFIYLIEMFNVA